jgi:hypothetical protein
MGTAAIIMFAIIFAIREITHYLHDIRRDKLISELTDKIKAKDFTEYSENTKPMQRFEPVTNDDKELYYKEIEEMKQ